MKKHFFLWTAAACALPTVLVGLLAGACDSNVVVPDGDTGPGGSGGASNSTNSTSTFGGEDAGPDALTDFEDPGCEDQPPPLESFVCDPQNQDNGDCLFGEACYIFVEYPDEPCGQEIYGSICFPAGIGQQGDLCGGAQDCGAGLACVVTGSGTQCVNLCPLEGSSDCPSGLVCEPIDVEGFGGCL